MTDKQIKQNAKAYAVIETACNSCQRYCERGFIAGAHSRDEEINALHDLLDTYEIELNKLRNPWISAEERPKKTDVYYVRTRQGCADMAYFDSSIEKWEKGRFTDGTVTHWMPIPKLKGGACMKK